MAIWQTPAEAEKTVANAVRIASNFTYLVREHDMGSTISRLALFKMFERALFGNEEGE